MPDNTEDGHTAIVEIKEESPVRLAAVGVNLFINNPTASSCSSESAIRSRTAQLNRDGIENLVEGDVLRLNLFDDAAYDAKITKSYTDANGAKVVTGTVEVDDVKGVLYMSTASGKTAAFVDFPSENKMFSAGTEDGTDYTIFENDTSRLDIVRNEDDTFTHKALNFNLAGQADSASYLNPEDFSSYALSTAADTVIDLMIVYTSAAKKWADSNYLGPVDNILGLAVARANTAFSNSGTGVKLRIVHSQEIKYVAAGEGKGSSSTDLNYITFDEAVKSMRNKYGADIVTLVTACDDIGGLGWLFNGYSSFAYNMCRVKQLAYSYTLAHECGHNLGCGHLMTKSSNAPGYFPYSAGWEWTGKSGRGYHTVMTYGSASYPVEVPYFSNPSIFFGGMPTGDTMDANNTLTIINLKQKVASFRPSVIELESK